MWIAVSTIVGLLTAIHPVFRCASKTKDPRPKIVVYSQSHPSELEVSLHQSWSFDHRGKSLFPQRQLKLHHEQKMQRSAWRKDRRSAVDAHRSRTRPQSPLVCPAPVILLNWIGP